jgi:hypothetical protein
VVQRLRLFVDAPKSWTAGLILGPRPRAVVGAEWCVQRSRAPQVAAHTLISYTTHHALAGLSRLPA